MSGASSTATGNAHQRRMKSWTSMLQSGERSETVPTPQGASKTPPRRSNAPQDSPSSAARGRSPITMLPTDGAIGQLEAIMVAERGTLTCTNVWYSVSVEASRQRALSPDVRMPRCPEPETRGWQSSQRLPFGTARRQCSRPASSCKAPHRTAVLFNRTRRGTGCEIQADLSLTLRTELPAPTVDHGLVLYLDSFSTGPATREQ
ncbi:Fc.00g052960.m01.CDS01 [Cosmosporella sp. VM-42]